MASSLFAKDGWWNSSLGYAPLVAIGFISYAGLCSLLRFRRINNLKRRFNITNRESLSRMTNEQAQEICLILGSYEFPKFYDLAMQVALLKTYCIDSIAELLMQVSDLKNLKQAAKRYDDTEIIFSAMLKFKPESVDLHQAVARMNFLHSSYIKSGKITNKDLLYVLGASMREPVQFIKQYDWRRLTDMEVAALGTLWMYIGRMMEIDYVAELGKDAWEDGLEFMADVTDWISDYEDEHMRPSKDVLQLGSVLMELIMSTYPAFSRPAVYQGFSVLLGDRLRHVLGLKEPTVGATALVYSVLTIRQFFARYLMPPRIIPLEIVSDRNPKTGRFHHLRYLKEPWYNPVTIWSRWNSQAIITRLMGGLIPGDDAEMLPEGFTFGDIGPKNKMGKGADVEAELEARAKHRVSGGCPFKV